MFLASSIFIQIDADGSPGDTQFTILFMVYLIDNLPCTLAAAPNALFLS